ISTDTGHAKPLLPGAVWTSSAEKTADRLQARGLSDSVIVRLMATYGGRATLFEKLLAENPAWRNPITPQLPHIMAEAAFSARHEMAVCENDFLERRSDLALCAKAEGIDAAPLVSQFWRTRSLQIAARA